MMKAEDLKNSILQMAMQGKLVPQDPNDEPATTLLEKIKQEKEQLIKNKKIKRNNKESTIWKENGHWYEKIGKNGDVTCIDKEIPFEIPETWSFVRFGSIVNFNLGKTPPRKEPIYWENATIPWVSIADMNQSKTIYETKEKITEYALENKFKNQIVKKGTLIMSFKLTVGKTSILGMNAVHNEAIISIYPYINEKNYTRNYLFHLLPLISISGNTKSAIKGKTLNSKSLNNLLISLPPLNEQKRIVQKLEQILPQIEQYDKYEQQLTKLNEEFPEKLKKSILQQAIQGKLVPQDPNDEPASVLLEKIKEEKEQLIKEGKIKRNKNESTIYKKDGHWYEVIDRNNEVKCIDEEIPFEIPKEWIWTKLDNISFVTKLAGFEYSKYISNNIIEKGIPLIKAKNLKKGKIINVTSFISEDLSDSLTRSQLINKCILTPYVGASIGNIIIFSGKYKAHLAPNVAKIELYGSLLEEYVKLYLESFTGYQQLTKYIKSTAQPSISMSAIRDIYVPMPPINEQILIKEKIEKLFKYIK